MRSSPIRMLGLCALAAGPLGCDAPATQLVVLVDSDFLVPGELAMVEARVLDAEGREVSAADFALAPSAEDPGPARFHVPLSFAVVPSQNDASRRVTVEVEGVDAAGGFLVRRRAVTGFVEEQSLLLPMFLARACARVECPDGRTCHAGVCVDADVPPSTLPLVRPGAELLVDAGDRLDAGPRDAGLDATGADGSLDGGCVETRMCGTEPCSCGTACFCELECVEPAACQPQCLSGACAILAPGTGVVTALCARDTSCTVDATGSTSVSVDCRLRSDCAVDCREAGTCTVTCASPDARCLVDCDGATTCEIQGCRTPVQSCAPNILACNRACP